jgi:hypothetical protein
VESGEFIAALELGARKTLLSVKRIGQGELVSGKVQDRNEVADPAQTAPVGLFRICDLNRSHATFFDSMHGAGHRDQGSAAFSPERIGVCAALVGGAPTRTRGARMVPGARLKACREITPQQ